MQPVQAVAGASRYLADLQAAQRGEDEARRAMALQSQRANQADELARENARLRALLDLRQNTTAPGRPAEVLFDAADLIDAPASAPRPIAPRGAPQALQRLEQREQGPRLIFPPNSGSS